MSKSDVELGRGWTKPKRVGPIMTVLAIVAVIMIFGFWKEGQSQDALMVAAIFVIFGLLAVLDMLGAVIKAIQNLDIRRE